ncbi:MAG: signal peptidase I [Epulopiscium sp. Nele67-Bin005]|nr:MAG: signal peptidase I [Epulopiscium sp. Nele67-Bin005]
MIRVWRLLHDAAELIVACLVGILIFQFIGAKTYVPTGSMIPTINIDDHMLITNVPYYYRHPKQGEIVIFRLGDQNVVKRVIGMPNDVINISGGKVYVNDVEIDESNYVNEVNVTFPQVIQYPYLVPENSYFVLGDNRTGSGDSRSFGAISRDDIFATGAYRVYPFDNVGLIK